MLSCQLLLPLLCGNLLRILLLKGRSRMDLFCLLSILGYFRFSVTKDANNPHRDIESKYYSLSFKNVVNWVDVVFVVVLVVSLSDICAPGETQYDYYPWLGLLRVLKVLNQTLRFTQVNRVASGSLHCLSAVAPQVRTRALFT